jgi:methylated-DNA-[protein]-cysteine S-methyltransferase
MIKYFIFKTLFGWMGVVETGQVIKKIILPHSKRAEIEKIIFQEFPEAEEHKASPRHLVDSLVTYYQGKKITHCFSFDAGGHTEFILAVWKATQAIPWGEVRSYQWISVQIKKPNSSRAVGCALGKNPFPIIVPCHRVIRSDGTLGGFSAPGGILLKKRLLELEGVKFDRKGRVTDFTKR